MVGLMAANEAPPEAFERLDLEAAVAALDGKTRHGAGLMIVRELRAKVGDLRQFASVRRITLDDGVEQGVRALAFSSGGGLDFWVLCRSLARYRSVVVEGHSAGLAEHGRISQSRPCTMPKRTADAATAAAVPALSSPAASITFASPSMAIRCTDGCRSRRRA